MTRISLVSGGLGDSRYLGFDYWKLQGLLEDHYGKERGRAIYYGLMENSGLLGNLAPVLSPCNQYSVLKANEAPPQPRTQYT